ncbi:MAG: hypothetical protein ABS89_05645 [Thiobacillus sp. SCN 63-1177]|nr:MAG: hypothetical protein ABS89_05645 [Thiobacillus sp. SCN 63-1177]
MRSWPQVRCRYALRRVVGKHGGDCDGQAQRGHDQRLADRAGDLVEAARPAHADVDQRVINAPYRAEQADEGRRGGDRRQHGVAVLQACGVLIDRPPQRAGEEFVFRARLDHCRYSATEARPGASQKRARKACACFFMRQLAMLLLAMRYQVTTDIASSTTSRKCARPSACARKWAKPSWVGCAAVSMT